MKTKEPEFVKITPSGKVRVMMPVNVLADFLTALEKHLTSQSISIKGTDAIRDVVLLEMYNRRFAGAVSAANKSISFKMSEAIAIRSAWRRNIDFRQSNMLNVVLMKLDQKLS